MWNALAKLFDLLIKLVDTANIQIILLVGIVIVGVIILWKLFDIGKDAKNNLETIRNNVDSICLRCTIKAEIIDIKRLIEQIDKNNRDEDIKLLVVKILTLLEVFTNERDRGHKTG